MRLLGASTGLGKIRKFLVAAAVFATLLWITPRLLAEDDPAPSEPAEALAAAERDPDLYLVKPASAPKAAAKPAKKADPTNFAATNGKGTSSCEDCVATVEQGALSVQAGEAKVKFEYQGISWGGQWESLTKDISEFSGKSATTWRGTKVTEVVDARDTGFESTVTITERGGDGDLVLSGTLETSLTAEETFECEPGATTFTSWGDLILIDQEGNRLLAVCRTTARDADGSEENCAVTYTKTETGYSFDTVVPEPWLAKAKFPIKIDPLIGTAASATSGNAKEDMPGGAAWSGSKYLITYWTKNGSVYDTYARFINADGSLSGSPFLVIASLSANQKPRVAYVSGSSGIFGIVYVSGANLWMKRYNTSGTLQGSAIQINTATAANNTTGPDITSDGSTNFLIAWVGSQSGVNIQQIWGELRNSAGTLIKDDTTMATASGSADLSGPDVLWNSSSSRWFLSNNYTNGSTLAVQATIWNSGLTATAVATFTIVTSSSDQNQISANAWNSVSDEYFVTWNRLSASTNTIRGRRISNTGSLLGSEIAVTTEQSVHSDVSYTSSGNRYLVTYENFINTTTGGVMARIVLSDGTVYQGFTINDDTFFRENTCRIGRNATNDEFLAIWQDLPSGTDKDVWSIRAEITPPPIPTGLGGTGGDTTATLTWTAVSAPDLAGYNIYMFGGFGSWIKQNASPVVPATYLKTGLTNGTDYEFKITSIDTHDNESNFTSVVVVRPKDLTIPATPTGLVATPGNKQVNLSWTANTEGDLAGYNVYRSLTAGGTYTKINASIITGTSYSNTSLTNGTPYFYKISALDISTNESPLTAYVTATPNYPKPTALTLLSTTYNSASFRWTAPSGVSDLAGYNVYRSTTSGTGFAKINGGTPVVPASYVDSGLGSGTYYYVVTAVSTVGDESLYSNEITAVTVPVPVPTLASGNTRKTNDQTPLITGTSVSGYTIKLWEGTTLLGTTTAGGGGAFSLSTITLAEGVHVIQATATIPIAGSPTSIKSGSVIVTVDITAPAAPVDVSISKGATWIEVRWRANEEPDLLGYNLYRRVTGTTPWIKQNDKPLANPKYLDSGLSTGASYEYKVAAVDDTLDED